MKTSLEAYRQQLLFALRMRNVPGPRIGEAIAEVESHIAETDEDPVAAFGPPDEYARQLAESLAGGKAAGRTGSRTGSRPGRPGGRWTNAVVALVAFAGAAMAATGRLRGNAAAMVAGPALLVGLMIWLVGRRSIDRIVDPRTGRALRLPAPRRALAVFAVSMVVLLVIAVTVRQVRPRCPQWTG